MALKNKTHDIDKAATMRRVPQQAALNSPEHERSLNPIAALQRATAAHPSALRPADILALQRTVGNRAVQRMLSNQPHATSPQSATPANAIQRQTEEEEPLQGKFETAPRTENRTGLPDELKAGIENLSGLAMDDVRVHYNSARPAQVEALAYTHGTDIHVAPGQDKHLPHEAWHVVQQKQGRVKPTIQAKGATINDDPGLEQEAEAMGEKARQGGLGNPREQELDSGGAATGGTGVVQGYFDQSYLASTWVQSDDMTVVAEKGYPNHKLYAKAGKAATANVKLAAVNSGVELIETGTTDTFWEGSRFSKTRTATLKKIEAKNKANNTRGDDMTLYADCGKSNAAVVGSTSRQAVYDKPGGAANTKAPGDPQSMKVAIMKAWMEHQIGTADPFVAMDVLLARFGARSKEGDLQPLEDEYRLATTDLEKKAIKARYTKKLNEIAEAYWDYYNKLSEVARGQVDAALKINRYAKPDVGQGYTMSSGGPSAGKSTWNFHWGGVVMASDDGKDNVVLENYAVGDPAVENKLWTFDIYGTEKKGQTFHERHSDTQQHGQTPTTMTIEKKP